MIVSKTGASVCGLVALCASPAWASVVIETVPVGNPGNAGELSGVSDRPRICGAVAYTYNIGKYEVTAGQYCEFLNAVAATDPYGLYNTDMWTSQSGCKIQRSGSSGSYTYSVAPEWASRPVNFVSYWDSCRFANWLHNNQPTGIQGTGTTETGAYTLNGYNGDDGREIQRNAGWTWAVTSEDEWYKAAYYKGGSTDTGYFDYPTRSDTAPGRDMADASGNNANWRSFEGPYPIDSPYYTTVAGEFENSHGPYGTFDQGGNVCERNEAIVFQSATYAYRGVRGGSFYEVVNYLHAQHRAYSIPTYENFNIGFRVSEIPEPATLPILSLASVAVLQRRRA